MSAVEKSEGVYGDLCLTEPAATNAECHDMIMTRQPLAYRKRSDVLLMVGCRR